MSFVYELVQQISLTPTVSQLFFKARRDFFSYEAGQYLEVVQQDGTFIPLSIANAPLNCAQIEIHLAHPNNNLPAQKILRTIAEDAVLTFRGPFGVCTKNKLDVMRPIIFIVRETGFAPVQAILESFSHDAVYPPMYLYWSGENYLASLAEKISRELKNFFYTKIKTETLQQFILKDHANLQGFQVYMVSSKKNVLTARAFFVANGLRRTDFYSDLLKAAD